MFGGRDKTKRKIASGSPDPTKQKKPKSYRQWKRSTWWDDELFLPTPERYLREEAEALSFLREIVKGG